MLKKLVILVIVMFIAIVALVGFGSKEVFNKGDYFTKSSDGLSVGSQIDFALPNQNDVVYTLQNGTKSVIFVSSKPMAHIVKNYLSSKPEDFLPSRDTLFVADISPMPVAIRNLFAMPDLKKSKYSVLLIFKPELAAPFKNGQTEDKIVIAHLDGKRVTKVAYATNEQEFADEIK